MRILLAVVLAGCSFRPGALATGSSDARTDTPISEDGDIIPDSNTAAGHVRRLDVVAGRVAGGPHADFPLLVELDESWLRDVVNSGDVARGDGFDIYFAADIAGTNRLAHEVESYSASDGRLTAWVKLPSLMATTSLFLHYGDPAFTVSQQMRVNVWTGGYELVLHLGPVNDATGKSGPFTASTSGTAMATIATGTVFNGSSDRIDAGSVGAIDDIFAGGGTAEGWVFAESYGEGSFGRLFDKGHTGGWSMAVNDGNATKTLAFVHGAAGTNFGEWNGPSDAVTQAAWHHLAVTYDSASSANDPTMYVDGVALQNIDELVAPTGAMDSDASITMFVGNRAALDRTFDGTLDELRLSSVARSASWLLTQFRNQSSPDTFYSVSAPLP